MILDTLGDFMGFYSPKLNLGIISINSAFLRDAHEDYYFEGEIHDFWEMVYALEGSATVSEDDRIYEITEGQAVFHKPMEFHRLWCKKGQKGKLIIISFSYDGNLIDELGKGVFMLNLYLRQMLTETFEHILANFDCSDIPLLPSGSTALDESICVVKLELLLLSIASEISPDKNQAYTVGAYHYKNILNVMKSHIDENLSVDEIAALCCLSTSNLKKTFHTYAGCGVMQHFNRLRIMRAGDLLRNGLSVAQVSDKMSFSSPGYFSSVFKRETGMLPTQYRANKK